MRWSRVCLAAVGAVASITNPRPTLAARPAVAVFDLESKDAPLTATDLAKLSEYIGSKLIESGQFEIIPPDDLKAALRRQKAQSFEECYAESCQIEVGQELAAAKSLAGTVSRLGERCIVNLKLYDLKKSTQEAAGTAAGVCTVEGIFDALEVAVGKLTYTPAASSFDEPPRPTRLEARPPPASPRDITAPAGPATTLPAPRRSLTQPQDATPAVSTALPTVPLIANKTAQLALRGAMLAVTPDEATPRPQRAPRLAAASWLRQLSSGGTPAVSVVRSPRERDLQAPASTFAYSIDRYEVTVDEYGACVATGHCERPRSQHRYCNWGVSGRARHPVNCIDWTQAAAFCRWAGKRLPTDAEWTTAARGDDGRVEPWGDQPADCRRAVMDDRRRGTSDGCGRDSTWPIGSKPRGASPYGALDMVGNVREWTDSHGPGGRGRVVRGGSWLSASPSASNRDVLDPHAWKTSVGFRCARTLPVRIH